MADIQDVLGAESDADSRAAELEAALAKTGDYSGLDDLVRITALATLALCERINAAATRLDFVAYDLERRRSV